MFIFVQLSHHFLKCIYTASHQLRRDFLSCLSAVNFSPLSGQFPDCGRFDADGQPIDRSPGNAIVLIRREVMFLSFLVDDFSVGLPILESRVASDGALG